MRHGRNYEGELEPVKPKPMSEKLLFSLWNRFGEMNLPERGGEIMLDDQARNRFVRKGWVLFVARSKKGKLKSMSLHPSHGAKLP